MKFGSLVPRRDTTPAPREDAFDPFTSFRRDVERTFDDFFRGFGSSFGSLDRLTPSVRVTETDIEIVVTAELPGLDDKDLDVTLSGDVLTITGQEKSEHEQKDGDSYYVERSYGSFSRSLRLPFVADGDKVEAKYDNGMLTVRVPKPGEQRLLSRRGEVRRV